MPLELLRNKQVCCVKNCTLFDNILYNFPPNTKLQNRWKNALKMNIKINDDLLVCSKHFQNNNFFGSRHLLKDSAVPDKNLPIEKEVKTKANPKLKQLKKRINEMKESKINLKRSRSRSQRPVEYTAKKTRLDQGSRNNESFIENRDRCSSPDFYGFDLSTENRVIKEVDIKSEIIGIGMGINIAYPQGIVYYGSEQADNDSKQTKIIQNDISCCVQKCISTDDIFYKISYNINPQNDLSNVLQINNTTKDDFLMCATHFLQYNLFTTKDQFKNHTFSDISNNESKFKKLNADDSLKDVINTPDNENDWLSSTKINSEIGLKHIQNDNENVNDMISNKKLINCDLNLKNISKINDNMDERSVSPDFHGFDIKKDRTNYKKREDYNIKFEHEFNGLFTDSSKESENVVEENFLAMQDVGVQTDSSTNTSDVKQSPSLNNRKKNFLNKLNTSTELECWTGIKSIEIIKKLISKINELKLKNNSFKNNKYKIKNSDSIEQLLAIVMVRLKTNLSFLRMSTIFNMTEEEVFVRFKTILPTLRSVLYTDKNWPSKRLGKSFCLILEPFEFSIETKTNSQYEENSTVKALVGLDDSGNMIWSSKIYFDKITYDDICKKEDIYDKLRRIDSVVVQKNLSIHNEFKKRGLFCYTDEKALKSNIWKIKTAIRNHIYSFEIFQKPISRSLVLHLRDIFLIICFLINEKL